ncbi:MAG: hypothetical protein GTN69_05260 [Armatimonadetes bacterium]|nr:hypothetical protein [Armatimonadota bacterium]NIO75291.1 hypothetical protein [Armatimonadota bacterium]NIO95851.1 hypothetical protein [Armatimonadota bacterium]
MINHEMDAKISQALKATRAAPPDGWRSRTLNRLDGVRPARRTPKRWLLVAVGVIALFGLGFVPIPMGEAPGALDRALAQAEEATTVYITGHAWRTSGQEFEFEKWMSDDGFYRSDKLENGEPVHVSLKQGATDLSFNVGEDGEKHAWETFDPLVGRVGSRPMPDKSWAFNFVKSYKSLYELMGIPVPDFKITERRERSLWTGKRDVVEVEFTVQGGSSISGVDYRDGDLIRIRAEIDPRTDRMLSMTQFQFEGTWEPRYEAQYMWDVEIPQEVREFTPPEGTKFTRSMWWKTRVAQTLASSETEDWIVTLHAVDINRRGDIVLSLNRTLKPDPTISYKGGQPFRAEATDNAGGEYEQLDGFSCIGPYWTTTLEHKRGGTNPSRATITIYPYPEGQGAEQSVTFADVPLPPRQKVDDVFAAETEVIQY